MGASTSFLAARSSVLSMCLSVCLCLCLCALYPRAYLRCRGIEIAQVAAVRKQQRLSKQQLLPVFNRTMWVQQQIVTLRDGKWRTMLLQQAQRFESDLREALIAAS